MRTPSRPGLAALALVSALGLVGCSGSEEGNVEDNVQIEDGAGTDIQPSDITTPSVIEPDPGEVVDPTPTS